MANSASYATLATRNVGDAVVIYAAEYLNKTNGERIEREVAHKLNEGFRRLIINFQDTNVVNSIGISILLGLVDLASKHEASLVFSNVSEHPRQLFEMLGLTRHIPLVADESIALGVTPTIK